MEPEEFADFRRSVLLPMLRRHEEMFPALHRCSHEGSAEMAPKERYAGTEPYAPCPCNSGRKYKFCCRGKGAIPLRHGWKGTVVVRSRRTHTPRMNEFESEMTR